MDPTVLSWRRLPEALSRFFFAEVESTPAGLLRIGYALLILIQNLAAAPNLYLWFSEHGVLTLDASRSITDRFAWTLFQVLPATDGTVLTMFVIFNVLTVLLLVGFRSRWMAPLVYVLMMSFHHRNRLILDGQDGMLRTVGFMLMFMPLSASFSMDRWLAGRRGGAKKPGTMSAWPLRVLQLQMTIFFFGAALWKLKGAEWLNGTSLFYVSRLDNFFNHLPFPQLMFRWMPLVQAMTWGSLVLEVAAPFLIWFQETRRATLAALLIFHLGIHWMMNLLVFHFVMLLGWSTFLSSTEWAAMANAITRFTRAIPETFGARPKAPARKAS